MLDTISFYTPLVTSSYTDLTRGYGNAGFQIVTSLQKLGVKVPFDDPVAPVQISFCQPQDYKFYDGQYKIGYCPWESTELPHGWVKKMNECDEIWATSQWVADVYSSNGVKPPIYIYEHGLDPLWQPVLRKRKDVIKFLHVGEPALRKGGQMTLDAFRSKFGDRTDVHLTFKVWNTHYLRSWKDGLIIYPRFNNVTINDEVLSKQELYQLYQDHDVLVYPSYGEGFGFIPLQALGSGMPVISTYDWAPYKRFLRPLEVRSTMTRSIWTSHPGDVFYPDYLDLKLAINDYICDPDEFNQVFYDQAADVHVAYNWLTKTEEAFESLSKRITGS